MIKRLIISSLVAISVVGIIPIAASATWKEDSHKNHIWVEKGVVAKGWKQIDGQWYNFGNNGIMQKGWMLKNGIWHYVWSDGIMASNCWVSNGGFWYYFDANGNRVADSSVIEKRKYDFTDPTIILSQELDASTSMTNTTTTTTTTSNNK